MKQAIAYIRVSTHEQAVEGVSLQAQQARIETWCEQNDYDLAEICIDAGISGSCMDNRPELQRALAAIGKGRRHLSHADASLALIWRLLVIPGYYPCSLKGSR